TRSLSVQLGISRNSVMHAYEQLRAEGYLESRMGSGTRLCQRLPHSAQHKSRELNRQSSRSKLTRLIARSGYPLEQVGLEDCDGNSIYCYSDELSPKPK
ncbi:MAG: GntR family transcriptional regulator, partial [Blastocatellia bacterium]